MATPVVNEIAAPPAPTFRVALAFWLKLGFISFGGPAGQIAVMHQELVERRRWISERRFLHALNYCMLLPGPEATQLATYVGWLLHRTWGGIAAGTLFVLPSLFILIGLSWVYVTFGSVPAIVGILYGVKPAVTAIVLFAAYRIGSRALRNATLWTVAAAAFVAIFALGVPFPYIVLAAGIVGLIGARVSSRNFQIGDAHRTSRTSYGPALIDDATPPPAHAIASARRVALVCIVGLAFGAVPFAILLASAGWSGTLTQMAAFFTKAALMTFGGAYAVLPYVYQGAVEHYGWLAPGQMIDGLALGETTPGPLIMVVAFVGFVGAVAKEVFGPAHSLVAGAVGATVATWFTFVPSFLFILIGGPLVESTHGDLKFTAPLTAITAAVVGVIVNLAVFFAYHVFWPSGLHGGFDWISLLICAGAAIALFRFGAGVIPVIAACAVIGFASSFIR